MHRLTNGVCTGDAVHVHQMRLEFLQAPTVRQEAAAKTDKNVRRQLVERLVVRHSQMIPLIAGTIAVSYTHLTLPTILRV